MLNPAEICLNGRALVLDPEPLTVLVIIDASSDETLDVLFNHSCFKLVCSKWFGHLKVLIHLLQVASKLAIVYVESLSVEGNVLL